MFTLSLPRTLAGALLLSGAATAQAATLLVTVKADAYDGVCNLHCSLRDAVAVANQSGTANTILLPSGTYTLTRLDPLDGAGLPIDEDGNLSGDLDVVGELRIKGAGAGNSIIMGASDDFYAPMTHRLLEVSVSARLVLEDLALKFGRSAANGGAVENHGRMQIRDLRLEENFAIIPDSQTPVDEEERLEGNGGGAIANYGELSVMASHFEKNRVMGENPLTPGVGSAIYNRGILSVRDSHFEKQALNAITLYNKGKATIERSSFIDNSSRAIANEGGQLTLTNSTISKNEGSALINGRRDEMFNRRSTATLNNVTIAGNAHGSEYAVANWAKLRIRNSQIVGNGISFGSRNCWNFGTNHDYQAVGLLMTVEVTNCQANLFAPYGFIETFEHLLAWDETKHSNGTSSHALLPGSPAIDAAIGACPNHDQGGAPRPQDGNGDGVAVCDLGAIEFTTQ